LFSQSDLKKRQQQVLFASKTESRHKEKEVDDLSLKLGTMEKEHKTLHERTKNMNEHLDKKSAMFERTDSKNEQTMRQGGLL
jgi:uncharacterized membrane protein